MKTVEEVTAKSVKCRDCVYLKVFYRGGYCSFSYDCGLGCPRLDPDIFHFCIYHQSKEVKDDEA